MNKNKTLKNYLVAAFIFSTLVWVEVFAQTNISEVMNRKDLNIQEIQKLADEYFKVHGTDRGSGYKLYHRWLYERKFHLDDKGYFIDPKIENAAYQKAIRNMGLQARSSIVWSELGPRSWNATQAWNPGIGRLTTVAIHPSNTSTIYVGSPGGGIWKSSNGGNSWNSLIDNLSSSWMNVFHLCIDPSNPNTIYASIEFEGVIKSTNAGLTWIATGDGPSETKQVKVHPSDSKIVFAAAKNGIWRSTNGGVSWTQTQKEEKEDIEFHPTNPNIMYASGSGGTSCIWRSTNNGVNWTAITSQNGVTHKGRTLIAVSPNNPSVVYAVQADNDIFGRMYKSTNSGVSYTTTVVGKPSEGTNYFGTEVDGTGNRGQASYDMAISVNPSNVNEVHIGGIQCWKSLNGGVSFQNITSWEYPNVVGYNHADIHGLEFVGSVLYSVSDGGIYKSTNNGGDWTDLSEGLGIRQIYKISCSKTDADVIAIGAQDNGSSIRTTNNTWIDVTGADGMDNAISLTNPDIIYLTTQFGNMWKTSDGGETVQSISVPAQGNWVTPIALDPSSHDIIYAGWQGIHKSTNGGQSWTKISSTISEQMDALTIAPSNAQYIYASSGNKLYRTTNGGSSWTTINAPSDITSIFVSEKNPSKIWITCSDATNRVFSSTDAGTTFVNISAGLPELDARTVVVDEDAIETIYVGMNIGVYYRDNVNNKWNVHGLGLPLVAISELEIQKSEGKLRVATYGRGVWESDLQNGAAPTCASPTGLNTSNIKSSSATLNWSAVSGASSYRIIYRLSGTEDWTLLSANHTSTNILISGLIASRSYDWRVRANCGSVNSNSIESTFTTLSNDDNNNVCPNVSGLRTSNITTNSATLNWTASSNAVSYRIVYRLSGTEDWTLLAGAHTSTSISLSGLDTDKSYDWRIRANCTNSNSSYSQSSFSTQKSIECPSVTGLKTTSIETNAAILNWAKVSSAVSYRLEYRGASPLSNLWNWTEISNVHTTNSIRLSNLNANEAYEWRVRANCATSNGNYTNLVFTTLPVVCHPVSSITALASTEDKNVELSWKSEATYVYEAGFRNLQATEWKSLGRIPKNKASIQFSPGGYEFRVLRRCTGNSSSAYKSVKFNVYCKRNANASDGFIDKVQLGSISRVSGKDGGYYDATSQTNTNISIGGTCNIELSAGGLKSSNDRVWWRVFIDYNRDGDFNDPGELNLRARNLGDGLKQTYFVVPNNVSPGKTRMRVSLSLGETPLDVSCGNATTGEVEDYTVTVIGSNGAQEPMANPNVNNTAEGSNQFQIQVYPNPASDYLNVNYFLEGDDEHVDIQIFDMQGRSVQRQWFQGKENMNTNSIDISNLGSGKYILMLRSTGVSEQVNFVVER